ncbi:hypothetical protein BGZ95_011042 [Linnemannia exigua]|uniref:Zinc-finger domain-containing protein n=1 Tax=Linnemannia exigua TaxID=604196 RepID=A0AAD4H4K0_9FUNG|nr:hypothetical protein BGZ95_011042 [Linnemannia exigua]
MSTSQYEWEREKTLRNNRLKMEELFGSSTPAADMRQMLQGLQTEDDTTTKENTIETQQEARRGNNRLFTSKEVDMMEAFDKSQTSKRKWARNTPPPPPPPPKVTTKRYVLDHIFISRRTSRLAARETTEKIKDHIKIITSTRIFPTATSETSSYRIKKKQMPPKMRQRQVELLQEGRINHCHLCAKERPLGWKWFNLNTNEYDSRWKCPICREFCNCAACSKNNWGRSNERRGNSVVLTRSGGRPGLRSSGGSSSNSIVKQRDDPGDDEKHAGQKGLWSGSLQQRSRNRTRSTTNDYDNGDDMENRRSTMSQPSRAAEKMAKGRLQKEVSFNDDEDVLNTSEAMNRPKIAVTKTEDEEDNVGDDDCGGGDDGSDGVVYVDEGEADVSGEDLDEDESVDGNYSAKRKRMAYY